ncbi:methylenetetrahydrofolate reductase [Shigella flexneri]
MSPVAAYPEAHRNKSAQADLLNLKRKVDAGANRQDYQLLLRCGKLPAFSRSPR